MGAWSRPEPGSLENPEIREDVPGHVIPILQREFDDFDNEAEKFLAGETTENEFIGFRLKQGVYGQRQADVQMIRVKLPFGGITPEQMETFADVVERWVPLNKGHITTRQNIQMHHVPLRDAAALIREISDAGLSSREGCGNTVRNVTADPWAGVCHDETFDPTPYAGAYVRYFVRHPTTQLMPRKVKTAFTGSDTDRALTGIHDVAFIARERDGVKGFEMRIGGGTSIMPRVAPTLIDFVRADDGEYLKYTEAVLRIFDRQDWLRVNRARARLKVMVDKIGIEAMRELVEEELQGDWVAERDFSAGRPAVPARRGGGRARAAGRRPARRTATSPSSAASTPPTSRPSARRASRPSRSRSRAATSRPSSSAGWPTIMREFSGGYARTTVHQNFVLRWVRDEAVYDVWARLNELGLGEAGADQVNDVVSCPGTDSCKLGITSSMGLNRAVTERIEAMKITDPLTRRIHIKMSGCPNGCSQHHIGNIGFYGASIKVGQHTIPAYVAHIGGNYEGGEIVYGTRLKVRLPAKRVPEAVERWIRKYEAEREDGEVLQRLRRARRHQGVRGRGPRPRHARRVRPGDDERVHRLDQEGPVRGPARRGRVRGLMDHLEQLEAEAIHVIREVAAELEKPVLLFSGGKDSIVLLHLARKAFRPGDVPFPVMHVDTGHNFPEVIEFRDRHVPDVLVASVQESIDRGRVRDEPSRNQLQTTTLLDAIEEHGFDAAFGGARRDEERSRAKERVFSFRDDFGQWDPRRQRPELWDLYNGRVRRGEHVRVFPLSNWTELDVWEYIRVEELELPPIYFAHEREVFERDGMLYAVIDFLPLRDGEEPFEESVRYRTVGDMTCTGAVRSRAATLDDGDRRDRRDADHRARRDARRRPRERGRHGRPQASRVLLMLRVATAGSVDDGKSTLIGRLLHDSKSLMADELGTAADLARLTDGLRAEREQGITIDVAYRHFATPRPPVRAARLPRPRAVHAQHGHRRLDRRPRARAGRRPPGDDRAVAPPPGDRGAARRAGRDRAGEQDGPRRLRRGALRRGRARGARLGVAARPARRRLHPGVGAARRQRRRALGGDAVVRAASRCSSTSRRRRPATASPTARPGCRSST